MSELSPEGGSEGYGVCDDERRETEWKKTSLIFWRCC